MAGGTVHWEIAGLVLSVAQMLMYINGFNNYKSRLNSLTDELKARADAKASAYQTLRDKDGAFYAYYQGLPDYSPCQSNIERARGSAFAGWGSNIRQSIRAVNGFSQLQKVNIVNSFAETAVFAPALNRAFTAKKERDRVDAHVLARWEAITSAPTYPSAVTDYSSIINSSFGSLNMYGQGANSAGVAIGTSLGKLFG
jgi:hypothetical protein